MAEMIELKIVSLVVTQMGSPQALLFGGAVEPEQSATMRPLSSSKDEPQMRRRMPLMAPEDVPPTKTTRPQVASGEEPQIEIVSPQMALLEVPQIRTARLFPAPVGEYPTPT